MAKINIYQLLAEKLDFNSFRPMVIADAEKVSLSTPGEEDFYVVKNRKFKKYLRLSPRDNYLFELMDGRCQVKDLVLNYYFQFGTFAFDRIGKLVHYLFENLFFQKQPVRIFDNLKEHLEQKKPGRWLKFFSSFFPQKTFDIKNIDRILGALYRHIFWIFFTRAAKVFFTAIIVPGIFCYLYSLKNTPALLQTANSYTMGFITIAIIYILVVTIHELAHAMTVKYCGREIIRGGFMFYLGSPCFFVDTTDAWMVNDRKKRVMVSGAGPLSELIIASIASILIVLFPNFSLNSLLLKLASICYIGAMVNINPLLELDGYFILVDFLGIPALRYKAFSFLKHKLIRKIWRLEKFTRDEKIYAIYGFLSFIWTAAAILGTLAMTRWQLVKTWKDIFSGRELFAKIIMVLTVVLISIPIALSVLSIAILAIKKTWSYVKNWPLWQFPESIIAAAIILTIIFYFLPMSLNVAVLLLGILMFFSSLYLVILKCRFLASFFAAAAIAITIMAWGNRFPEKMAGVSAIWCLPFSAAVFIKKYRPQKIAPPDTGHKDEKQLLAASLEYIFNAIVINSARIYNQIGPKIIFHYLRKHISADFYNWPPGQLLQINSKDLSLPQLSSAGKKFIIAALEVTQKFWGQFLLNRIILSAYDNLHWQEREIINLHILKDIPYFQNILKGFPHIEEKDFLSLVTDNPLFKDMPDVEIKDMLAHFREEKFLPGQRIITQEDIGDKFYFIKQGVAQVLIKEKGNKPFPAGDLKPGDFFGEITLLQNVPRTATVIAVSPMKVLSLSRNDFNYYIKDRFKLLDNIRYNSAELELLKKIPLFSEFPLAKLSLLTRKLKSRKYQSGEQIIKQGEPGAEFFIIKSGLAEVYKENHPGSRNLIATLGPGEYFGEISLVVQCPRTATIMAKTELECLMLAARDFQELLGKYLFFAKSMEQTFTRRLHNLQD